MNFKFKTRKKDNEHCTIRFNYNLNSIHGYLDEGYDYDGTEFGGFRLTNRTKNRVIRLNRIRTYRHGYANIGCCHYGGQYGSFRSAINYDLIGFTYPFTRMGQTRLKMKRSIDGSSLYRSFFITKTDRSYVSNSKQDWYSEHLRYRNTSWNGRGFRITNDDECISANWNYNRYMPELSADKRYIPTKTGFKIADDSSHVAARNPEKECTIYLYRDGRYLLGFKITNQCKVSLKYNLGRNYGISNRESRYLLKFKITSTEPYRSIRHGRIKTAYPADNYWINRFKLVNIFN